MQDLVHILRESQRCLSIYLFRSILQSDNSDNAEKAPESPGRINLLQYKYIRMGATDAIRIAGEKIFQGGDDFFS